MKEVHSQIPELENLVRRALKSTYSHTYSGMKEGILAISNSALFSIETLPLLKDLTRVSKKDAPLGSKAVAYLDVFFCFF